MNDQATQASAWMTAQVLADGPVRWAGEDAAVAWKQLEATVGPAPISAAWFVAKSYLPGVDDQIVDGFRDDVTEMALETALAAYNKNLNQYEHTPPLLTEQQGRLEEAFKEAAIAQADEHWRQRAALDDQLEESRARFSELHKDDPPEKKEHDAQRLDEAEQAARADLDARQTADREAREAGERATRDAAEREAQHATEQAHVALQQEAHQVAEREARQAAEQEAREVAEKQAREVSEREAAEREAVAAREAAARDAVAREATGQAAEKEASEAAAREAAEVEAREQAAREAAEQEAREAAEKQAREAAAREAAREAAEREAREAAARHAREATDTRER